VLLSSFIVTGTRIGIAALPLSQVHFDAILHVLSHQDSLHQLNVIHPSVDESKVKEGKTQSTG